MRPFLQFSNRPGNEAKECYSVLSRWTVRWTTRSWKSGYTDYITCKEIVRIGLLEKAAKSCNHQTCCQSCVFKSLHCIGIYTWCHTPSCTSIYILYTFLHVYALCTLHAPDEVQLGWNHDCAFACVLKFNCWEDFEDLVVHHTVHCV